MALERLVADVPQKVAGGRLFGALVVGAFGLLLWAERRRALREKTESKPRRVARNVAVAGVSAVAVQLAERPLIGPLVQLVGRRRLGLLQRIALPRWLETTLAVVLMDYTLYWWHVLLHELPWLYRYHQVHHVDLDLDTSTALRFHFGELVASVPWRAAQAVVLGIGPGPFGVWQKLLLLSVMFHHSNVRLPLRLERWLSLLVVTPRLHGIHHSVVQQEQDSNWSSGLTLWDRLHGTYRANVPQEEITIGVPAYRDPEDVTLPKVLTMPFTGGLPGWEFPDGTRPERRPLPVSRDHLLP
jgi:sterol desaturase/sphingolipid hydroxylase (fatty acid hydroxylase superfamily)